MFLIGSRALMFQKPHILSRKPKDFDFVCTREEFDIWLEKNSAKINATKVYPLHNASKMIVEGSSPCEFEIITPGSSAEMLAEIVKNDKDTIPTTFGLVPSLDMLFTIKSSHRYLKDSPHFWKNLEDYHKMKACGASVRPEYQEFLKAREKETYKNKTPKLAGVSKNEFFNPNIGIKYVFDHDSLHVAVKHLEQPAYRYFQKDNAEVQCDKAKFFNCNREIQLLSVLEESYVLALERSQIPYAGQVSPKTSFAIAFSKVCTSISSGWWREFAYENAMDVLALYNDNYMDKFAEGIASGVVKPFEANAPNNPYK